jgi:hypothetical protein
MSEVVCAELSFEPVGCGALGRDHNACVVDKDVEFVVAASQKGGCEGAYGGKGVEVEVQEVDFSGGQDGG